MSNQDKNGELHSLKFALSNYLMSIYMKQESLHGETKAKRIVVDVLKEQLSKFNSDSADEESLSQLMKSYEAEYKRTKSDLVLQDYLAIERTIEILKQNGAK